MINITKALFFDIETHRVKNFCDKSPATQDAFINHYFNKDAYETPEKQFIEEAGLHAEFSQIICVSFGFEYEGEFRQTVFSGTDEREILEKCTSIFNNMYERGYYLAGHAISTCDIPFFVKRYIINKMKVPKILNEYNVKPWEKKNLDTMGLWKFGMYRGVALETICAVMGIDCKTDNIRGDNLYLVDIEEMPWKELEHYCSEDVKSNYLMMKQILEFYET
jgi:predicted PolB exonuclease-like 3'-5' exonuclease